MGEKMRISYILPGKKGVETRVTVKSAGEPITVKTRNGNDILMQNIELVDETGSIILVLWSDNTGKYRSGDVLNIKGAYAIEYDGKLQLRLMKTGTIEKEVDKTKQQPLEYSLPDDVLEGELAEGEVEFKSPKLD
jgi:ssDNA-binding replication factor A large subunit